MSIYPNTFIIGAQKAGTTAFYNWLSQHPDVYAPNEVKDLHFFTLDQYYDKGTSFLLNLYRNHDKQKIVLTAGVNYIYHPFALDRIKAFNPNAKMLLILRDPVKRAFSAYNYFYKLGYEDKSFYDALKREKENTFNDPIDQATFTYMDHGLYAKQIKNLYDRFPKEQIKILIYEELMANKPEGIQSVYNFLKIDPTFECDFTRSNFTGKSKMRWINKLIFQNSEWKEKVQKIIPYKKFLNLEQRNKLAQKIIELNTNKKKSKELSEEEYEKLQAYFTKDIIELSKLLNKDLKNLWSYK